MSDNVINMASRRKTPVRAIARDGLVYCGCGDAWWVLFDGCVNFTPEGQVVGWSGSPMCRSCGRPMGDHSA